MSTLEIVLCLVGLGLLLDWFAYHSGGGHGLHSD